MTKKPNSSNCEWENATTGMCGDYGVFADADGKVLCEKHGQHLIKRFGFILKRLNICKACGCRIDVHGCGCNPHDA